MEESHVTRWCQVAPSYLCVSAIRTRQPLLTSSNAVATCSLQLFFTFAMHRIRKAGRIDRAVEQFTAGLHRHATQQPRTASNGILTHHESARLHRQVSYSSFARDTCLPPGSLRDWRAGARSHSFQPLRGMSMSRSSPYPVRPSLSRPLAGPCPSSG